VESECHGFCAKIHEGFSGRIYYPFGFVLRQSDAKIPEADYFEDNGFS